MKIINEEMKQKLLVVAKDMFDQQKGDPEYPFDDMSDQYEELLNLIQSGGISEDFINFSYRAATE